MLLLQATHAPAHHLSRSHFALLYEVYSHLRSMQHIRLTFCEAYWLRRAMLLLPATRSRSSSHSLPLVLLLITTPALTCACQPGFPLRHPVPTPIFPAVGLCTPSLRLRRRLSVAIPHAMAPTYKFV